MITIQSGKLIIPEEDRFVGFAGDNLGNVKTFVLPNRQGDSGSYMLCLRFDDDSVRVIPLAKFVHDGDLVLTWRVLTSHLLKSGIVMAQVKSVDSEDVVMHTSVDYFLVAQNALEDENAISYVTREEMEERMAQMLEHIRQSAPYIDEDGYWYVYDVVTDSYVKSVKATPDFYIDDMMVAGSTNPVTSSAIQAYVTSGLDGKVGKNTSVAGLPLSGSISAADLANNLSHNINPIAIVPGTTAGYSGQYGKTSQGEPVMCGLGTTWVYLATRDELGAKMALTPDVSPSAIENLTAGQLFTCHGGVSLKTSNSFIDLARADNVYSKSYIDGVIGNLETILSAV